jgi:antitoxin VapB
MSMSVAKVLRNGESQLLSLPKDFRFDTDEVFLSREGNKVVLFPKPKMTWEEFFEKHEACPEFELDRSDNGLAQDRDLF